MTNKFLAGPLVRLSCLIVCLMTAAQTMQAAPEAIWRMLYKRNLPSQNPERTLELLERSLRLGSGQAHTEDWQRSWKLVQLSKNDIKNCNEEFFKHLNELIDKQFAEFNRIVDYIAFCRQKQLDYCRRNFGNIIVQSVSKFGSQERQVADLLFRAIAPNADLSSIVWHSNGLARELTKPCQSGLLQVLESLNGPLRDKPDGFNNFERLFHDSIGLYCSTVEFAFESATFTLLQTRPTLEEHTSQEWMIKAKLCAELRRRPFVEATYKAFMKLR